MDFVGKIVVQVLHKINQQSRHPKIWPLHGKIYQWAEKGFKQPSSFWNSIKAQGVSKCPLIYHWAIFPDGIVSALDNLICVIDWTQWEIIRSHFVTKLPASLELYLDNARYKKIKSNNRCSLVVRTLCCASVQQSWSIAYWLGHKEFMLSYR